MKNKMILVMFLICSTLSVFGQAKRKLDLYLKDGSIIAGALVAQTKDASAIIAINDSFSIAIPLNEIKKSPSFNPLNPDSTKRITDFSQYLSMNPKNKENPYPPLNFSLIDTTRDFIYTSNKILYGKVNQNANSNFILGSLIYNDSIEIDLMKVLAYKSGYEFYVLPPDLVNDETLIFYNQNLYSRFEFIKRIISGKIDVFLGRSEGGNGYGSSYSGSSGSTELVYFKIPDTNKLILLNKENLLKCFKEYPFMTEYVKSKEKEVKDQEGLRLISLGMYSPKYLKEMIEYFNANYKK